jgi:hypothetical protein
LAQPAVAGAWSQDKGDLQMIVTLSRETGDFDESWRASDHFEAGFGGGWATNLKAETEVSLAMRPTIARALRWVTAPRFQLGASLLGGESIDAPDCEGSGYETRAAIGTSFAAGGREGFVNLEGAAKSREDATARPSS